MTLPWNVTVNATNSTGGNLVGSIPHSIIWNLPWWPAYITIIFYIALLILFSKEPGKDKLVLITFLGMIFSWLMLMFGMFVMHYNMQILDYGVPTACTGLFIVTFGIVKSTS